MLAFAFALVDMGVAVFACPLKSNGDPIPPRNWETTKPDRTQIGRWKPGMALCAVTGDKFAVIDMDPRNGGELSLRRLKKELGDDFPNVYVEVNTASGGKHLYVASLGIRKTKIP